MIKTDEDNFIFETGNAFKLFHTALVKRRIQYPECKRQIMPESLKGPYLFFSSDQLVVEMPTHVLKPLIIFSYLPFKISAEERQQTLIKKGN